MSQALAVAISRPSALKAGARSRAAVAAQALDERAPARVDQCEESVVAADDQQPAARHVTHAAERSVRDCGEVRERAQRPGVDQADGPVALSDGQDPAVRAQRVAQNGGDRAVARLGSPDGERAAQAAVAGEVPDHDPAIQR